MHYGYLMSSFWQLMHLSSKCQTNSTKCSLASVISLVFLCSVCSAILYSFRLFFVFSFNFLKQYLSARNLLWSNHQKTLVFSVGFQERAHCLNVNQGNQTCLDPWLKKICSDSWLVGKFTSLLTGIFVSCS